MLNVCVCIKYLFNVYKDTKVICFYHFNFVFKKVKMILIQPVKGPEKPKAGLLFLILKEIVECKNH